MRTDCETTVLGFGRCDRASERQAIGSETFGSVQAGLKISASTCEYLRNKCERDGDVYRSRARRSEASLEGSSEAAQDHKRESAKSHIPESNSFLLVSGQAVVIS